MLHQKSQTIPPISQFILLQVYKVAKAVAQTADLPIVKQALCYKHNSRHFY